MKQEQGGETDATKPFKRFLLINGIIVGALRLIGSIVFLFMVPRPSEYSSFSEKAKLKAEVPYL